MQVHEKIGFGAALVFVAYLTKQDIHEKRISLFAIILSGSIALLYLAAGECLEPGQVCFRILPGVLLILVALLSGEKIGYGDGISVLVLGLWTSAVFCLLSVTIGLFLAGIYGVILLCTGKKEREIPFLPFLLAAMEVLLIEV